MDKRFKNKVDGKTYQLIDSTDRFYFMAPIENIDSADEKVQYDELSMFASETLEQYFEDPVRLEGSGEK